VLSRDLAARGHYPAVDVLASASRVMSAVVSDEHQALALKVRGLIADYREAEDLINIGAYQPGSNVMIDEAIARKSAIDAVLKQSMNSRVSLEETLDRLYEAVGMTRSRG
jgi:flagellum-specific ATP synthase